MLSHVGPRIVLDALPPPWGIRSLSGWGTEGLDRSRREAVCGQPLLLFRNI